MLPLVVYAPQFAQSSLSVALPDGNSSCRVRSEKSRSRSKRHIVVLEEIDCLFFWACCSSTWIFFLKIVHHDFLQRRCDLSVQFLEVGIWFPGRDKDVLKSLTS